MTLNFSRRLFFAINGHPESGCGQGAGKVRKAKVEAAPKTMLLCWPDNQLGKIDSQQAAKQMLANAPVPAVPQ